MQPHHLDSNASRRLGDQIAIEGDYQYRVLRSGPAPQRFWHEAKLREAELFIAPAPGETILDLGCGSGVFASRLATHPGTLVIGVDGNRNAYEFARQQFRQANLEFRHGLVDELK